MKNKDDSGHDIELEKDCEECLGSGSLTLGGVPSDCYACNGTGRVLTKFGEEVLSLVRRNIKPMIRSAIS